MEAFNRILTGPRCPDADGRSRFTRGIPVFTEKPDLVPFEAAKLYCHNAGHATAAYLAQVAGLTTMDQLTCGPICALVRRAMVDEARGTGAPLRRRGSPLHPAAMAAYADDLIARMVNPFLRDGVALGGPGSARKLGWDDRLVGAMRLALDAGSGPERWPSVPRPRGALHAAGNTPLPTDNRCVRCGPRPTRRRPRSVWTWSRRPGRNWPRGGAPVSTPWHLSA
ncbi:MAG: hypothetical protein R2854_16255 [Caldilineaceae bacterium]